MADRPKVKIVSDGGCDPNPGVGGWGAILIYGSNRKELYGGEAHTTNNAMEITAALMGLRALKTACEVEVVSDSQYLVHTMMLGWKRRKNLDLWQQLDEMCAKHVVTFTWVRGHAGHADNERAHVLAERGIAEARRGAA